MGDVLAGPTAGLSVFGQLELQFEGSGHLTGSVVHADERLSVTGQVDGRSLSLVVHLPNGRLISGVGTSAHDIRDLTDLPRTGTLTGPNADDHGAWLLSKTADSRGFVAGKYSD